MNKPDRKETYQEKLNHLMNLSGKSIDECEAFMKFVYNYLDSSGYFEGDYNIHGFKRPDDWINYGERDFGTWLLDMALLYNMEQGMEYECKFKYDRTKEISFLNNLIREENIVTE